jgi:hypothetical protein
MATRFIRKMALLAKAEASYGVDSVPTGAANAIQATEINHTPLAGGEESRDLLLPYLGNQGRILNSEHAMLEFSVEMAGAGAAGTPPPWGVLHRGCGMLEAISAGVSVTYSPVSANPEALSIYFNLDGVRHIMLGNRANVSVELTAQRIPRWRYRVLGLLGTISDLALPAVTLTGFQKPVIVNKANTTFSLHGVSPRTERISVDLGNQVNPDLLINWESIEIDDRQSTGSSTFRAEHMAVKDWFATARAGTLGTMAIQHGTVAGNIVEIDAPAAEIGRPTQGNTNGKATYTTPLAFIPSAGNDELVVTVR